MNTHRARVMAAVERHLAGRSLAGHWPIDARYPWASVAGCSLHCSACGATGAAPLPRAGEAVYNAALAAWLQRHRDCGLGEAA